jgi:enoyl-CoA hydratase
VAVLTFDRPPANAFDLVQTKVTIDALTDAAESAKAVVVTGTGSFFSGGLDLKAVPGYDQTDQREMILLLGKLLEGLYGHPRPTVAAVNGHAVAAGTLLALACDYRVGPAGDARFGLTGTRVGIPYPASAQAIIDAELDPATRRVMLLGAGRFGPEQAVAHGVLDELQPPDAVLGRAIAVATERSQMPPGAYAVVKQQLRAGALERIRHSTQTDSDPLMGSWLADYSAGRP